MAGGAVTDLTGKDRLIVALDVDNVKLASDLVDELKNVHLFKIGWQLLMAGLRQKTLGDFWNSLERNHKELFIDLKLPDVGDTLANVVRGLGEDEHVRFVTLHESTALSDIALARQARGSKGTPKLLTVPFLSSMDEADYRQVASTAAESGVTLDQWILTRARLALDNGCDGIIASGDAIRLCRTAWPRSTGVLIVSPGIRPQGTPIGSHKRFTTPGHAIELGADYLVVGQPILNASNRYKAAQDIIDEIDEALSDVEPHKSLSTGYSSYAAAN